MNKLFNLMLFVAWLVFNSESFELDFCPFFCCVFCIMSVTKIKDQNPLICKTFFCGFLIFHRAIHVSTVADKANFVDIEFISASIKIFLPESGEKCHVRYRGMTLQLDTGSND